MVKELCVGVPVFGQIGYTHALIEDLRREGVDFVIIDNRGDYTPLGRERVITPNGNLGWAGGSNLAFRIGFSEGYDAVMTLNNDVRLSPGYFRGVLDDRLPEDAGVVCGVYDDHNGHPAMLCDYRGPARDYEPRSRFRRLKAVDGTGLMLRRDAFRHTGGLDETSFGRLGWGADLDLCLRVRAAGMDIVATEMSYLNHFRRKTANAVIGRIRYPLIGGLELSRGMKRLHGPAWRDDVVTREFDVVDLDTGSTLHTDSSRRLWKAARRGPTSSIDT